MAKPKAKKKINWITVALIGVAMGSGALLYAVLLSPQGSDGSLPFLGPTERSAAVQAGLDKASKLSEQRKYKEALALLTWAANESPKDYETRCRLGAMQWLAGKPEAAEATFESVLKEEPTNGRAHYGLGLIYKEKGPWGRAMKEFRAALRSEEQGEVLDAHYQLGLLLMKMARYDHAIEHFDAMLDIQPENPWGFYGSGLAQSAKTDYKAASKSFEMTLSMKPDMTQAAANLAVAYFQLGEHKRGITLLEATHKASPGNDSIAYNLASAYLESDSMDMTRVRAKAEPLFKQVAEGSGKYAQIAYYKLASLYSMLKNEDQAVAYMGKAMELGFRNFRRVEQDYRMEFLVQSEKYKKLIAQPWAVSRPTGAAKTGS